MREFFKYYFLKVLLVLVALQLLFFFWLEKRDHRPVVVNDEISVYEGHSVRLRPLRNDTDKDEDDVLSISEVSKPMLGSIEHNEDLLTYSVPYGRTGVDSFAYKISDGKKNSKPGYIKINVNKNLPPLSANDQFIVYQGNKYPLPILGNDRDQEGDSIFIKEISSPIHGKITKEGNNIFYLTERSAISDSFHYVLSDGFSVSGKTSVKIEVKSKSSPLYPWLTADIGNPSIKGNTKVNGTNLMVQGSGDDIWNNADNFHYAYQFLDGDCEMITLVKSIDNTNEWAKGGIMIREMLTESSKNIYMCLSKSNGVNFQTRLREGESTLSSSKNDGISEPYWLKLVRKGNLFTGYCSPNGQTWTEVGSESVEMPKTVYIGLATTSHNNETLCTVHYNKGKTIIKKK